MRPSAGHRPQEPPDPADALGVEPVDRLVEDQHGWIAEEGAGDAEPLAACPSSSRRPAARRPPPRSDEVEAPRGPAAGRCRCIAGYPQQMVVGRCDRGGPPRRRAGRRPPWPRLYASVAISTAFRSAPRRPSTASSPSSMRIVVDLPAPLGPTNPVTRPGSTVKRQPVHCQRRSVPLAELASLDHLLSRSGGQAVSPPDIPAARTAAITGCLP